MSPPFLPVITVITLPDGSSLTPAKELRILSPLSVAFVTGDGPDRIELGSPTALDTYPAIVPVPQSSFALGSGGAAPLAFSSPDGSTRFARASMVANAGLVANDTDYLDVTLYDLDLSAGTPTMIPGTTRTTKTIGSGGSGDWTGNKIAIDIVLGVDLAAGHALVALWTKHGAGIAHPGGLWRAK